MVKNSINLKGCLLLCMIGAWVHAPAQQAGLVTVTDEMPCDPGAKVFIGNIIRRVTVLTTHENKVRLVTTVAYEGNCGYSNEKWLDVLELKVSGTAGEISVKSGNMPLSAVGVRVDRRSGLPQRQVPNNLTPNGTVVFDSKGNWLYKKGNIRRNIIVYVPVGAKLDIDSRYAEIILDSAVKEVDARITNGSMTMKDADRFVLYNMYGSVYASNIGQAEVELNHGWFHSKNISTLKINSKASTVELGVCSHVKITSDGDQYEMEGAAVISGEKNYGSIRIDDLSISLDLAGVNSDIKVHNVEPGVSAVRIDGQYADLRLPVDLLKDYTVDFDGKGSNLYTPFERGHATDTSFNVTVGRGKKTFFRIKCNNCTLDMK